MKKITLDGVWQFTKENALQESVSWEEVTIPHTWNGIDGQDGGNDYYRALCWYQKSFIVNPFTGRLYIEFEGVNSVASVYLNGKLLGEHQGGYSTFRFDITDLVVNGENTLLVGADNSHNEAVFPLLADFTFYGGIYREVHLLYTNDIAFDVTHKGAPGVYVSQHNISKEVAHFTVDAYINNSLEEQEVVTRVQVLDHKGVVVLEDSKPSIVQEKDHVSMELSFDNPHLWHGVEDPYLYTILVQLLVNNTVVDERIIPTGFRFFHFDNTYFYLNGKQMKLNGVSRHQDRWQVGNALTKEMHDEDMAYIVEIGANSIRLAHYQQAQYFYDLCDQTGMIVWAEIPYITVPSKTDTTGSNALSQMEELIKQSYNHSSIIMWGVQNETTAAGKKHNLESIVQSLHDLAKQLDPTRLTTQAQVANHPVKDSMNDITDLLGYNEYFGWYFGEVEDFIPWLEDYRTANPNKPLGLSEYGVEGIIRYHNDDPKVKDYSEEYHALWHEKAYTILQQTDFVWGTYVWNMFAFAADFRDEGGVKGLNNKGLVTIDRKVRKDAFFYYKAKWNKEPMVHLTSKRFVDRPQKDIQVKAYSNQGTVEFYHNNVLVDTVHSTDVIFQTTVTLTEGENHLKVVSGDLTDSMICVTVDKPNPEYSVPKGEKTSIFQMVDDHNWIDTQVEVEEDIIIDDTYYSIKDRIELLLEHPEAEKVFNMYLSKLKQHPMFEMAKGMSLDMIVQFDKNAIPHNMLVKINKAFQMIKKEDK